jgi:hypothetical protein
MLQNGATLKTTLDQAVGSAMGQQGGRPAAATEPHVMLSHYAALQYARLCHRHSMGMIAHPQSLAHAQSELD